MDLGHDAIRELIGDIQYIPNTGKTESVGTRERGHVTPRDNRLTAEQT